MYETDLAPELAIGRFCYNDDSEITNFLNKLNSYTNNPITNGIKTALFVGEWLWDGPTWGGDYMDEMIGSSSNNGYTTTGVPASWNISTCTINLWAADSWGPSQFRPCLVRVQIWFNHLGHSSTTYTMRFSNNS
jgi:hypothetical protein